MEEEDLQEDGNMIATFGVIIVFAVFLLWYLLSFNALISARNATEQSWSNVEVELKRRFELIQNLVEVVKGYAQHERSTLEKVTALRQQGTTQISDAAGATGIEQQTRSSLQQLMVLAEAYPELKADSQFRNLHTELTETENRIATRRNAYNETVNIYLNLCQSFPSSFVATLHAFSEKPFFDAPDELATAAPQVSVS